MGSAMLKRMGSDSTFLDFFIQTNGVDLNHLELYISFRSASLHRAQIGSFCSLYDINIDKIMNETSGAR